MVSGDRSELFRNLLRLSVLVSAILGLVQQSWSLFGKSIALWLASIGVLYVVLMVMRARESAARREVEQRMADYEAFHQRRARLRTRIEALQERVVDEDDPWRRAVMQAALVDLHQLTDPYIELVFNPGELPKPPRLDEAERATHEISKALYRGSRAFVDELTSLVEVAKRSYSESRAESSVP